MKLLLDECIDRKFAREFPRYKVKTVPQMGWTGAKNELCCAASGAIAISAA
jgi:hypothetical protein